MLESIKKVDKKIITMAGIMLAVIVIILVAIIVVAVINGGSLSFDKLENKLASAAENYYYDNEDKLPKKVGETITIEASKLVSEGYIDELSEYTDEGVKCDAEVIVGKTASGYDYVTSLDCGEDYKTEFLADKLISETVTAGSGLYKVEDVVVEGTELGEDETGYDLSTNELMSGYIYRGETVNNYVEIDEELYRIVKIDGNKDLMLMKEEVLLVDIFDDRYNSELDEYYGINDYTVSRVYEGITQDYQSYEDDAFIKQKAVNKNVCIGARSEDETSTDGSVECSKVMKDQYYSLIPIYDIMNASLSKDCSTTISKGCTNYNYLLKYDYYWTMTTSTVNSYSAYRVDEGIEASGLYTSGAYRYVVYLSNRVVFVEGTGTFDDPYIVK